MLEAIDKQLVALSRRLAELLAEAEDPRAEMEQASARLLEAGVADVPPWEMTPREFAQAVIEDNPQMLQHLEETDRNVEPLSRFETADELVTFLIPSSESLD
mgnify:FL=1